MSSDRYVTRYWWMNRWDGFTLWVDRRLRRPLCGATSTGWEHGMTCDLRLGHGGPMHRSRARTWHRARWNARQRRRRKAAARG